MLGSHSGPLCVSLSHSSSGSREQNQPTADDLEVFSDLKSEDIEERSLGCGMFRHWVPWLALS